MTNPNQIKLGSISKDDYIRQLQRKNVCRNIQTHDQYPTCTANKYICHSEYRPRKSEKELLTNRENDKFFSFDKKSLLSRNVFKPKDCVCNKNDYYVRNFYRNALLKNGVSNSAGAKIYKNIRKNDLVHVKGTQWVSSSTGSKIFLTNRKAKTCCGEIHTSVQNHLGHIQHRDCCEKV